MKVIVIKGDQNAGKTSVSRFIFNLLLHNGAKLIAIENKKHKDNHCQRGDFEAIVKYGILDIAICSEGDALHVVDSNIKRHYDKDYVIVARELIHRVRLQTPGNYNIYNSMAALITAMECGISLEESANALKNFYGVKGRFEILPIHKDYRVIIDYAHTPDSLKQVLLSLSSFPKNRIITLFGCGGNRDKSKRGAMGRIAAFYSDMVILTSDNPRDENPSDIIDDIIEGIGITKTPVYIIENRRKAIEYALQKAQKNDIRGFSTGNSSSASARKRIW